MIPYLILQTSKQKEVSSESLNSTKNKRNMQANELSSSSPEKRKLSEATSQNSLQIISENNLSSINELQKEDHTINSSSTQSQSIADIRFVFEYLFYVVIQCQSRQWVLFFY